MTHEDKLFAELRRIGKEPSRAMERWRYGDPANHVKFEREKKGGRMQRDIDVADELLAKWAHHMRTAGSDARGYPRQAPGFQHSWIKDNEEMVDAANRYEMGKINAAIDSLIQTHQRIIYKRHNLGFKVWSFPDEDALYLAAKESFRRKYFLA